MINFLAWIFVGALIGWTASILMKTHSRQGLIANVIVGIAGAFMGGFFLNQLFNINRINHGNFSVPAFLASMGTAVIVLATFKLYRHAGIFLVILIIWLIHLQIFQLLVKDIHFSDLAQY